MHVPGCWLCCWRCWREALGAGCPQDWVTCGREGGKHEGSRDGVPAPGGRTALLTASPAPFPAIDLPRPTLSSYFSFGNDLPVPAWDGNMHPAQEGGQPTAPASLLTCRWGPHMPPSPALLLLLSDPELPVREVPQHKALCLRGNKAVW